MTIIDKLKDAGGDARTAITDSLFIAGLFTASAIVNTGQGDYVWVAITIVLALYFAREGLRERQGEGNDE